MNGALAVVVMVAPIGIAESAIKLDEELWRLNKTVTRTVVTYESWRIITKPLEMARLDFVNHVPKELGVVGPSLSRALGRPDAADPIWQLANEDPQNH